jgi:hypothetical protein
MASMFPTGFIQRTWIIYGHTCPAALGIHSDQDKNKDFFKLRTGVRIYENLCMQDRVNPGLVL